MARKRFNLQRGTISADMTSGDTTINFSAIPDFNNINSPDTVTILVNSELMYITQYTVGATTATVGTRGVEGTTAAAHTSGDNWAHVYTTQDFDITNLDNYAVASATETGVVELATSAEVDTGTDTTRAVTPEALASSALQSKVDGIEPLADVTDIANVILADAFIVVNHGATAATARPSGAEAVYWIGSVEPDNLVEGDLWYDTDGVGGGGGGAVTLEEVQDNLGNTSLVAGTALTKTYDDGANTITLDVDTAMDVTTQTGTSYTLAIGDDYVRFTNAAAVTVDLPQDSDAAIAVGTVVTMRSAGAGGLTAQAGTGATVTGAGSIAQDETIVAVKVAADTWDVSGATA